MTLPVPTGASDELKAVLRALQYLINYSGLGEIRIVVQGVFEVTRQAHGHGHVVLVYQGADTTLTSTVFELLVRRLGERISPRIRAPKLLTFALSD